MAEATVEQVECGFCVTRLEDLEDSRSLPCSHVHCLRCLLGNFEVNKIVRCPFCRYHLTFEIFTVWVLFINHCEFYCIVCYILCWVRCIVYCDELVTTLLYYIGKYLMLTLTLFLPPTPEKVHLYAVIVVPGKEW